MNLPSNAVPSVTILWNPLLAHSPSPDARHPNTSRQLNAPLSSRPPPLAPSRLVRLPPLRIVRRERQAEASVGEPALRDNRSERAEFEVVRLEYRARGVRRLSDDGGELTQVEVHEWALCVGEGFEGAVQERTELVEVFDDREVPQAGREVWVLRSVPPTALEVE
ncbi:hypothetical protein QJS10_CPA05g01034 [Acorus calamus]|uniref:Uncharacterized protein n=1 Tax=Acorus calamus TaxID=4465 RepID=A0AAV9ETZ3_ACOCL|nr:hypothetical protein QJS10_CPA05g01034 [Acorus calamus]